MHRLINNLATIEANIAIATVEVNLKGYGSTHQYMETLRMAINFAHLHQTKNYLLIKNHFEDINYSQLYRVLKNWLDFLGQHLNRKSTGKTKVAILVNKDSFLELSQCIHHAQQAGLRIYDQVLFDIFFIDHKCYNFLKPDTKQTAYQSESVMLYSR